ncbi:amidohydrolase [Sphingosinicella rhizophila]|uniref:Amidohydrolase n=1 Tax=Sphingosinicella rhizophila TaxID=3050082 RepID=A0ABU3QA93_9SPHN|nr:amidohydrolase [Sphingosinicella sp. GR2756]MDT9600330.1 amidohydrolase [Sphingosinicella sp. GR2756]
MRPFILILLAGLAACASNQASVPPAVTAVQTRPGIDPFADSDPFPSSYRPGPSMKFAIVGATILTGTGSRIDDGTLLVSDGKIEALGTDLAVPAGYSRIDGRDRWVSPGVIDAHSHLGVWSQPETVEAQSDVNELTDPNTAQVWAEHSLWPQDPGFDAAREAGVTTLLILPGSGNLFGGRTVTVKNVPVTAVRDMKFPGAPYGLKIACGENPKRTYGGRGRSPATRMGNVAGYRRAWIDAADYARRWEAWRKAGGAGDPPRRDLQMDTLAGVLRGEILVQNHCYRADEMANMIDIAREFGFRIRAFHHSNEAYKVAPLLVREDICAATWTSWWGYKMEVFDAIEENAAIVHAAGGCAIIHSDDNLVGQRLNQEAAAALSAGRRAGLDIGEAEAIKWFTANSAKALGIADRTGSLEPGKNADVVLWSANPFSIYARADRVWIDGAAVFDRGDPGYRRHSDFLVGQPGQGRRP